MAVGKAVYSILSNASGVTDLTSTRIYPNVAPQGADFPYIVYQQISGVPVHAMSSDPGLQSSRVQVAAWDDSYAGVEEVVAQVISAMQDYSGSAGSETIQRVFLENRVDQHTGEPMNIHGAIIDFIMWHS